MQVVYVYPYIAIPAQIFIICVPGGDSPWIDSSLQNHSYFQHLLHPESRNAPIFVSTSPASYVGKPRRNTGGQRARSSIPVCIKSSRTYLVLTFRQGTSTSTAHR